MAMKVRERGEIAMPNSAHPNPLVSHEKLRQLYRTMLHCRLLAERMQSSNKNRFIEHNPFSTVGLEAIAVGAAIDLRSQDTLASSILDGVASYVKGLPIATLLHRTGSRKDSLNNEPSQADLHAYETRNILSPAFTAAAQLEICTNLAFANRRMKSETLAMGFFREDSIPQLEWQDALRFAGKHSLGVVYVRIHGTAPSSASKEASDPEEETAMDAHRYGFPSIRVDGTDVVAVYRVAQEAMERARFGGGPTLMDAVPAFAGHGSSENFELKTLKAGKNAATDFIDPLLAMEQYLTQKRLFSPEWKQEITASFQQEVDAAIGAADSGGDA